MVRDMGHSMRTVGARIICGSVALLASSAVFAQEPLSVPEALALRTVANPVLGGGFVAFNLIVPRPIEDGPGGSYLHLGIIDNPFEARTGKKVVTRWLVSGHLRNQWYQSLGRHKLIYIPPHIKGPEGAPLQGPRPTVRVVRR